MERRAKLIGGGIVVLGVIAGGAGIAIATANDQDSPLTNADLDRASAAALAETGGGRVIEGEVGDDGAAYTVEVRLEDGTTVEVQLDAGFQVTGTSADDDGSDTGSGSETD